jgi:hypothetical protein
VCVVCVAARVLLELTELASSLVCLRLLLVLCMPFFSVFVVARLWRSTAGLQLEPGSSNWHDMNGTRSMMGWKCQDISSCSAVNTLPLHAFSSTTRGYLHACLCWHFWNLQAWRHLHLSSYVHDYIYMHSRHATVGKERFACVAWRAMRYAISMQRSPFTRYLRTKELSVEMDLSSSTCQGKHIQTSEHPIWQLTSVNIVSKNKCQMLDLFALQSPD